MFNPLKSKTTQISYAIQFHLYAVYFKIINLLKNKPDTGKCHQNETAEASIDIILFATDLKLPLSKSRTTKKGF